MSDQRTHDESVRKLTELLKDQQFGMLTTTEPGGTLVSRPMGMQEVGPDGDLWFIASRDAHWVDQIATNPQVNVAFSSSDTWISLAGQAGMVDDPAKKRELWDASVEAWFPKGEDDPNIILIRVDATSGEYWDSPGGRIASAFSFVKAKVTGKPFEGGENEVVKL